MANKAHSLVSVAARHPIVHLSYPDAANRAAGTNETNSIVAGASNVHDIALQIDTGTYWILDSSGPLVWSQLMTGSVTALNPTSVLIANATGDVSDDGANFTYASGVLSLLGASGGIFMNGELTLVAGGSIVSTADGNITLDPNGAGYNIFGAKSIITDGSDSSNYVLDSLSMGHDTVTDFSWVQSAGAAAGDTLQLNPQGGLTTVGTTGVGSHALGTGDLYAGGAVEVDGMLYVGSSIYFTSGDFISSSNPSSLGAIMPYNSAQTNDSVFFLTGTISESTTMCQYADRNYDFAHAAQTNPTMFIQSANQSTTEYVGQAHNQTDAQETIGAGSKVTEHVTPVNVADDGFFDLPDASSGFGTFRVIDSDEFAIISWDSDGSVIVVTSNGSVVATDTDTNLCFFDNGTAVRVRNRLGAAKDIIFDYNYTTP